MLEQLDLLNGVRQVAAGVTRHMRLHLQDREPTVIVLADNHDAQSPGLIVDRSTFDQYLIDRAAATGVDVLQPAHARIDQIDGAGAQVAVHRAHSWRSFRCGLVVGADGLRSIVAHAAGLHRPARSRKFGFSFDLPAGALASPPDAINMFVTATGYLGVIRQRQQLHAAALVHGDARFARSPSAFIHEFAAIFPQLQRSGLADFANHDTLHFTAAGPMPCVPAAPATRSVALVGDAAGYVEPFTGEGMTWAIESAMLLDRAISNCSPGVFDDRAARTYARGWRRAIAPRLFRCRLIAALVARPKLLDLAARMQSWSPSFADRVVAKVLSA